MKSFRIFACPILAAALGLIGINPAFADEAKKEIIIGSATLGSSGYMHWEACSFIVNKYSKKIKSSSVSTSGSTESVFLLDKKTIQLGHGTTLEVVAGNNGTAPFKKKYPIWQVMGWNENLLPIIVLDKNTNIKTYDDLKGKNVCYAKKGSGTESMYSVMFKELGLYKDMKRTYLGFSAAYDGLVDGLVDAAPGNFQNGKSTPAMMDLGARAKYRILDMPKDALEKVRAKAPFIGAAMLPKTAYETMKSDVLCPSLPLIGISSPAVEDEVIYEFVKAVLENNKELAAMSSVSNQVTPEYAVKILVPGYPVHPGAARYYKEKGLWNDKLVEGKR